MLEKSLRIYKALFYLNLDSIITLIREESDLQLLFPIPETFAYVASPVKLTVFDILRMKLDVWSWVSQQEHLQYHTGFLPENMCNRALECKAYLEEKFSGFKDNFAYGKYRYLMLDVHANNNYIENEIFEEYLEKGYAVPDLELVNAALSRDEAYAMNALKRGANPKIKLFHLPSQSNLSNFLERTETSYFTDYQNHLMGDFNDYTYKSLFESLSDLYAAASTAKILLLIDLYQVD